MKGKGKAMLTKPNGLPKDFNKSLLWDLADCMDQFHALVKHPPLHSVVVRIEPPMAKAILKAANDRNRPLNKSATLGLRWEIESGEFELTGDTIKVSTKGRLIDGQHRLESCAASKGIETHMVFGLDERVFDILDRQRTRTAADILSIQGTKDATIVAGATRWAHIISNRLRGLGGSAERGFKKPSRRPSPRETRILVAGPMKDLPLYAKQAEALRKAYKIPPTLTCGLLWCIAQGDKDAALDFAKDWLDGNRNYTRNKNFDVLAQRIISVKAQTNGHLPRIPLAAMLVQTFNHWHANITATPRGLTWKREWAFPKIEHDKATFLKTRDDGRWNSTAIQDQTRRVLATMAVAANSQGLVTLSNAAIAERANLHLRQVPHVLRRLVSDKTVVIDKKGAAMAAAPVTGCRRRRHHDRASTPCPYRATHPRAKTRSSWSTPTR